MSIIPDQRRARIRDMEYLGKYRSYLIIEDQDSEILDGFNVSFDEFQ